MVFAEAYDALAVEHASLAEASGSLEAENYALSDQVTGLQEINKAVTTRVVLLRNVLLKILAERDTDENDFGDPRHCHTVRNRWDQTGKTCASCTAWDEARELVAGATLAHETVTQVESCNRPGGCVCGGDVPAVRRGCSHFETIPHRVL